MSLTTAANGPSPNSTANTTAASSSTSSQHQSGDVLLFSTRTLTVANVIQAHKSPLSFLSINSTGSLLATSSDKGTVIRVWSIPGAEKLYQFRRGTREAKIYSMNFNLVSTLLAVSSVHDTVHIFKLGGSKNGGETSGGNSSSGTTSSESTDGGASPPASLEGGYDTYIERKKSTSISYVSLFQKTLYRVLWF
jgi:autophagy-related protein 18